MASVPTGLGEGRTALRDVGQSKAGAFLGELLSSLGGNLDQVWLQLLLIQRCGIGGGVPLGASWMSLKSADPRIS